MKNAGVRGCHRPDYVTSIRQAFTEHRVSGRWADTGDTEMSIGNNEGRGALDADMNTLPERGRTQGLPQVSQEKVQPSRPTHTGRDLGEPCCSIFPKHLPGPTAVLSLPGLQ